MKDQKFLEIIQPEKSILIIASRPLDFDCLGSGLILKKYLESLGKKVTFMFPTKFSEEDKEMFSFLPYFEEIVDGDTRNILSKKNFDVLVLIDGTSLVQYYDTTKTNDNPPDLAFYDKIIHIDHHLISSVNLGTYTIRDSNLSATAEVILSKIIPENFIDKNIATLAYAAIAGDTGNFQWSLTAQTFQLVSLLMAKGADPAIITDKLFYFKPKNYIPNLTYILKNMEVSSEARTVFLTVSLKDVKTQGLKEGETMEIKKSFLEDLALKVPGTDRGIVITEIEPRKMKLSARGNNLRNKLNLPKLFSDVGAKGGGHFNACGADINGNFEEVKNKLIKLIRASLA